MPAERRVFYSARDPVLMGRTHIVCGGKRVSEDERKRKAGGRGAAAGATADPPMHMPRKRARTPQEPRTPAGALSGHPLPGTHTLGPLSAAAGLQPAAFSHATQLPDGLVFLRHGGLLLLRP